MVETRGTLFKGTKTMWFKNTRGPVFFPTLLALSFAILPACQPVNVYHGHYIKESDVKTLSIGTTTKTQAIQHLGTPTVILSYDPNTLYYLSHVVSIKSLVATQPVSSQCLALTFSEKGILSKISRSIQPYPVVLSKEATPLPSGHEEGFWQQVVRSLEQSPPATTIVPM